MLSTSMTTTTSRPDQTTLQASVSTNSAHFQAHRDRPCEMTRPASSGSQPGSRTTSRGNSFNPSGELGAYGNTGTNLSPGNASVPPEENRGYELGATWDFRDGLQLRTALFRNEKANARLVDVDGTITLQGSRRVDGVEIQLAGYIRPNWEIYSGFAFMRGEIVTGPANVQGNTPLGVPDASGNFWTTYRLGGGWEIGGGARYNSSFWLTDANNGKVPAYTVWDATVAYVQRNYEIRLNARNLGDKTYYVGGYQNNANRVLPGAPAQHRFRSDTCSNATSHPKGSPCFSRYPQSCRRPRSGASAPASTPRAGSTATRPRATSRRRPSTTSSCPRRASEARELGALVVEALARNPLFFSAALPRQVFPRSSTATREGMKFHNHVDGAMRTHPTRAFASAPTCRRRSSSRSHPRLRRRRVAGRGHLRRAAGQARRRVDDPVPVDEPAPRHAGHARHPRRRPSSGSRAWCATTPSARCSSTSTWRSCASARPARRSGACFADRHLSQPAAAVGRALSSPRPLSSGPDSAAAAGRKCCRERPGRPGTRHRTAGPCLPSFRGQVTAGWESDPLEEELRPARAVDFGRPRRQLSPFTRGREPLPRTAG